MKNNFLLLFLFVTGAICSCRNVQPEKQKSDWIIMDMVHHNPGEPFTETTFNDPAKLARYGFNAQVINEFQSVHTAITYESLNPDIFPVGSAERLWVDSLAGRISGKIEDIHRQGLEAYYFTDIIVLPKRLVEIYKDEICSPNGKIDFTREKTQEIHRIMIREVFERFPGLDGLIIRVGETYLHNIPYHTGNGPIPRNEKSWEHNSAYETDGGEQIHRDLMHLLREEVCVKQNKKLFYRTWDFGYFHIHPSYYLTVTDSVEPHPCLYMCIKHVQGDYHRTYNFNPTLGIGQHKQVVEIQCQREYEGKGAYPNYIADGVLNGFEELKAGQDIHSMNQLKETPQLSGIWTWSRGGGWLGPYISNELWCDLNAYVLAEWANHPERPEKEIFRDYALMQGFEGEDIDRFHRISMLSADAIVRGRASLVMPINVWWTRDQFIGSERELKPDLDTIYEKGVTEEMLTEKHEAVQIWKEIAIIADSITTGQTEIVDYIRISTQYGLLLFSIYEQGWIIMLKGNEGDKTGVYDRESLKHAIVGYDRLWKEFRELKENNPDCATLYQPFGFNFNLPPAYHDEHGLRETVEYYREKIESNY